jgi:CelD/BcsL family acetyltransferase involved in cellulose biosynthesis
MSPLEILLLRSADELRQHAAAWDELWQASPVRLPSVRAEPLAAWLEAFAAREPVRLVVAHEAGCFAAALPLCGRRIPGGLRAGGLTDNDWSGSADLLLRPGADARAAVRAIACELPRLPWRLLWLNGLDAELPAWRLLLEALGELGLASHRHDVYQIGTVELAGDWRAYQASRSKNHRNYLRKAQNRLAAAGGGDLVVHVDPPACEIEPLLRRGFEVEQRSWKGGGGTAVLQSPRAFAFYCSQARALAALGHLRLAFLEHAGRPIAFEYGWAAKGTWFSPKVGYDEAFAHFSPSQLLRFRLFERFHSEGAISAVDFHGPLAEATARWATGAYTVSRLLVALRGPLARAELAAYRALRPRLLAARRRLRGAGDEPRFELRPLAKTLTESG